MGISLWPTRPDAPLVPAEMFGVGRNKPRAAEKAPTDWRVWLKTMFPQHFSLELADHHVEFWRWVLSIKLEDSPDPFDAVWARGGGKSSSAEGAGVAVGVRGRRRYLLYVREVQDQADNSVGNISGMLELPSIERFYPEHARPLISKFGHSRGWRRNRLRTAGGFTVDALGLDVASRGLKVEEQRPDIIIFDDIDGKHDSPATTQKKIDIITHSILPAGAHNVAVLFIQNLIIKDGVAAQLADGRADFLIDRKVSGPHPAIRGLEIDWQHDAKTGIRRPVIIAGTPTWEGQSVAKCQHMINTMGLTAFMKECQHKVRGKADGVALRFDEARHNIDLSDDECRTLASMGRVFGGIDFGWWRFGFVLFAVDRNGVVFRIDEVFSQAESEGTRAQKIHETCARYGISRMIIWGDAANPQDIMEINLAFRRGWIVEGEDKAGNLIEQHVSSALRVVKVGNENKLRKVAVTRINDALDMNTLRFRRLQPYEWRFQMNAASEGSAMLGSRLMFEIESWAFPVPKAGEAQDQDPDDDTADGADMVAAVRYGLMSWWKKAKTPREYPVIPDDQAKPFDIKRRQFRDHPHAVDEITGPGAMGGRRAPRVRMPRPRIGGR